MRNQLLSLVLLLTTPLMPATAATPLQVQEPWVQEAPPGVTVLAAYLVITNPGNQAQTLVSVSSPDFSAVEIHSSEIVSGTARMKQLKDLGIPARGRQVLAPGGTHLMLMQAKRPLRAGDSIQLLLSFKGGATLPVSAQVKRASAPADAGHHHHH